MSNITDTDKAYLAGLIDGEGCVTIARAKYSRSVNPVYHLIVAISSCDYNILNYWAEKTGLGKVKNGGKEHGNTRASYQWWIVSRQAEQLLRMTYPYMMLKREQADIAFAFLETIAPNGTNGKTSPDIIYQRERYKQALTRVKGYKTVRGRPPKATAKQPG